LIWLIDPEERCVTECRLGQLLQVVDEHEELTGDGIMPDLRCKVADFFYLPGEGAGGEIKKDAGTSS
jgi:Uma2 family endonuclease